jgi:hypothetical protein
MFEYWVLEERGNWGNGGLGRRVGGMIRNRIYGGRVAWLFGSRYGTPGKVHQLQIQNPKERCTTSLMKIQDPMNLPPHSPSTTSPHHPNSPLPQITFLPPLTLPTHLTHLTHQSCHSITKKLDNCSIFN